MQCSVNFMQVIYINFGKAFINYTLHEMVFLLNQICCSWISYISYWNICSIRPYMTCTICWNLQIRFHIEIDIVYQVANQIISYLIRNITCWNRFFRFFDIDILAILYMFSMKLDALLIEKDGFVFSINILSF